VRLIVRFTAESADVADKPSKPPSSVSAPSGSRAPAVRSVPQRAAAEQYVLLEHWGSKEALAVHAQAWPQPAGGEPGVTRIREDYDYSVTS
jgi:hypothetical protein